MRPFFLPFAIHFCHSSQIGTARVTHLIYFVHLLFVSEHAMTRAFAIAALPILFAILFPARAQQFEVSPANPVLLGEPVAIVLSGLAQNEDVKITAERLITSDGKPVLYRANATFKVGQDGKLNLAKAAPVSGTYKGADARGLFWSMIPAPQDATTDRKPLEVRLEARTSASDKMLATCVIQFIDALPAVKTKRVDEFEGALFATMPSADNTKRPAIILLGGSEGGSNITRGAARLASYGCAVLALPYYSPPNWQTGKAELPTLPAAFADIPVDRLNDVRAWLQARDDVDGKRIAIHGTSKGAEFALLAGVHLPWVTAIVAVVPSDVVWEGWGQGIEPGKRASFALNGKPLPFVPYTDFGAEFTGFRTGEAVRIRRPHDKGRAANPAAAAARIPVEKIKAPVMLIAGQEDQVWNSAMMAHNIAERRAEAKLETVSLIYTDAGHAIGGSGYNPTTQYDADLQKVGGTPEGNARAQGEAWPKTIQFLKRTLGVR
jgi:dienelactone hydrolase